MKFKELSEADKDYIVKYYKDTSISWDARIDHLKTKFGTSERNVRRWVSEKLKIVEKTEPEPQILKAAKQKKHDKNKKIFLVTSAQGDTPVHKKFFNNLEAYAEFLDAEILVIPFRYQNPTSVFTKEQKEKDKWDDRVVPYLTLNRHDLNNGVSVLSDVKIQPTATQPLQGLEGMTGEHSCVVGHPRIELRSIPVMEGSRPKFLFSSGCCTVENYTDSKSGKKGEFHHSIGAAIIEIKDSETFFFRQISANKSGDFIDLFYSVKNGEITLEDDVEACAMGDIHVAHCDERVTDITLNKLFKDLYPKTLFIHDIMDSQSISHHNLKDPFKQHEQEIKGTNSLSKEIDQMIEWLRQIEKYNVYIVKSNHDEHIDKFLRETDWRKMSTFKNSIPYMELSLATLNGNAPNGVIPYIINKDFPKMKCLGHNDNVSVKGYLMSVHGHIGASGSRGSLVQYSRLSSKTVTGHSHSIGRIGGAVSVGTSTKLRLDYNIGASSWSNAHGIVNRYGKFQHIVFMHTKDGLEYTTLKKL